MLVGGKPSTEPRLPIIFFQSTFEITLAIICNDRTKLERMTFPPNTFCRIINIFKNDKMPESVCSDVYLNYSYLFF